LALKKIGTSHFGGKVLEGGVTIGTLFDGIPSKFKLVKTVI